jgi:hypothetical protein
MCHPILGFVSDSARQDFELSFKFHAGNVDRQSVPERVLTGAFLSRFGTRPGALARVAPVRRDFFVRSPWSVLGWCMFDVKHVRRF